MIFTKPAHRIIASTSEITEKPTVPFSPNYGDPLFPTRSAMFFTNLIAGQVDYIEDSVAGRNDFNQTNGNFGVFAEGEGYEVFVSSTNHGGFPQAHPYTDSFAMLIQCSMERDLATANTYLGGWASNYVNALSPKNSGCSDEGAFYTNSPYCLGAIGDTGLHYICIKSHKVTGSNNFSIAVDGVMVQDSIDLNLNTTNNTFRIGRNSLGRGKRIMATGVWHWLEPAEGADPLSNADMLTMTTNPWPHLAVLD